MWSYWLSNHTALYFGMATAAVVVMWAVANRLGAVARHHRSFCLVTALVLAPVPFGIDSAGWILPAWMFLPGFSYMLPFALASLGATYFATRFLTKKYFR